MYYVDTVNADGVIVASDRFKSDHDMFLWLESHGVTYYAEAGRTDLADGSSYEYGTWPNA